MLNRLKVAHILVAGDVGGIETLNLTAAKYSKNENIYFFLWRKGIIYEEMVSQGYRCEFIGTSKGKYLKDCLKIARLIQREKIDALICHFNNPFVVLCTLCVRFFNSKTKIIGYMHCSPDDCNRKTLICAKIIFHQAKRIICISDAVLNAVKRRLGFDDKLVRVYNGVDLSKFRSDKSIVNKTGQRLIYVGRLTEQKGVQIILNALAKVSIDYQFDVVGDGDYRPQLEHLVKTLGIEGKVTFYGRQLDVRPFLSRADIFLHLPTLEEGFGLTVVEAMATGLLCICSKSGGLPEIIENGLTGYLVEKNNPEELARAIQSSIENYGSEECMSIIRNAVSKAKEYAIDTYSASIDQLIDEISIPIRK